MSESDPRVRVFASGERVEPGNYIDMETGAVVRVLQPDELPHNERVVRTARLFRRLDSAATGAVGISEPMDDYALRS